MSRFNDRSMALLGIPDLPHGAFEHCGDKKIRPQGGGGGSPPPPSPQQVTTTSTNIPDWLKDPTQRMVARGEALSQQTYPTYGGSRVAGFTPAQEAAFSQIYGLTEPEQYAQSEAAIGAGVGSAFGYTPGQFDSGAAKYYMSPYQQAVTDIAKREAVGEAGMLNRELAAKASKAGAFGGSRFGIEQALLGSKLATNLSDIQTKGLQDAYLNAQQQFERDRAAAAGAAQLQATTGLQAGTQLANLGTTEQQQELNRIQALSAAGESQQAQQQKALDMAYQNYMEQRDWEKNQLGYLSGLIRGTPFSTTQTQSSAVAGPTGTSQLLSAGLGVAGLASLLKKKGGAIDKTEGLTKKQKRNMMGEGLADMGVRKAMGGK